MKLIKLLYFVDFDHYEAHDRSLTEALYRKLLHGPCPDKAERLIAIMESSGSVRQLKVNDGGYTQHRLNTLNAKFEPSKFSDEELQTLERVGTRRADASAAQIEVPWSATNDGMAIEYEMAEYRHPIGFELSTWN